MIALLTGVAVGTSTLDNLQMEKTKHHMVMQSKRCDLVVRQVSYLYPDLAVEMTGCSGQRHGWRCYYVGDNTLTHHTLLRSSVRECQYLLTTSLTRLDWLDHGLEEVELAVSWYMYWDGHCQCVLWHWKRRRRLVGQRIMPVSVMHFP